MYESKRERAGRPKLATADSEIAAGGSAPVSIDRATSRIAG